MKQDEIKIKQKQNGTKQNEYKSGNGNKSKINEMKIKQE